MWWAWVCVVAIVFVGPWLVLRLFARRRRQPRHIDPQRYIDGLERAHPERIRAEANKVERER